MNYTVLHLHSMDSNPKSGLTVDSVTPFQDYIKKAKECEMNAIAFTDHGSVLHNVAKKQMCKKTGIKYIHGQEFYVTENIDTEKLVRDNYHCILLARNKSGVRELNHLSSIANDREDGHFYFTPRISLDELCNTSDNILILTACVAGILARGTSEAKERFLTFIINNKHRCWLEIQPHKFDFQIQYNQYLYRISEKYNLRLVATSDIHAVSKEHIDARKIMQKAKRIEFEDEDLCDLYWMDYEEICRKFNEQCALPEEVYLEAIAETNRIADMVEDYDLDYSNKYPRRENAEQEFRDRINRGIYEHGINKLPDFNEKYLPRIKEEFETYQKNDAIDFMLLDSDYKNWMREHGMYYGPSRGSVSGSLIAYLIHSTDVDSVKYDLNFSRFMNPERQSLADIDTDIYADDRYKVREYFFDRSDHGDFYCCNIITFNTIKMRGAIKDVARALSYTVSEAQEICNMVKDENGKEDVPLEVREQHRELFFYVDIVVGTITSLGRHAAGIVVSPTDIQYDFGTLTIDTDPRPVSQIDMHEIDSLNYVKMDLLGLNAVGLINKACELAGIPNLTPEMIDFQDENLIRSMGEDTTMIFQFESGYASESLRRTFSESTLAKIKSKNPNVSYLDIMAMVSGAIRPAGESYRNALFNGDYNDNGEKALNEFLAPTLGYLVYQEQIIEFLNRFCGFTMGQADIIRRGFAKKTGTEKYIPIIKNGGYMEDIHGNRDDRYILGYITIAQEKYGMTKEQAEESIESFLRVIEDASSYLFSRNHSVPYSMIGFYIAYLRYYYPLQLLTAALNVYKSNDAKMQEIKAYATSKGIIIKPIKFRKSRGDYFMDVNENCIYQDIESIKECNSKFAEELFELGKNHYDSFVNLLFDIKTKTCIDSNQLDILIKLDFFSEFGEINSLLYITEMYQKLAKRKTLKKNEIRNLCISEDLIRQYSKKETQTRIDQIDYIRYIEDMGYSEADIEDCRTYKYVINEKTGERVKTPNSYSMKKILAKYPASDQYIWDHAMKVVTGEFSDIDKRGLLNELLKRSKAPAVPLKTKLKYQQDLMGYISYTDPTLDPKYIVVSNLDTTYAPKFTAYSLSTGKSAQLKVYKNRPYKRSDVKQTFSALPFNNGDIIYASRCKKEPKLRKDPSTDKWIPVPGEWVWWITDYWIAEL